MSRFEQLLASYRRHVALPLRPNLPLTQRVWFLVYPPEEERRIIIRVSEFELATRDSGLHWKRVDLDGSFADWMDAFEAEERALCLADPSLVEEYADPGYKDFLARRLKAGIDAIPPGEEERTVVAVTGLMDLYDFIHVSTVVEGLDQSFSGVLLVFFPGEREGNTFRFLGARTSWDYLAIPITGED